MCPDLDESPCVRNDRLIAYNMHLYPRWVLCMGNGINLHTLPTTWSSIVFAMLFIHLKKFTQFGALAGQAQHMASQKVGFTPQPIRYGSPD